MSWVGKIIEGPKNGWKDPAFKKIMKANQIEEAGERTRWMSWTKLMEFESPAVAALMVKQKKS